MRRSMRKERYGILLLGLLIFAFPLLSAGEQVEHWLTQFEQPLSEEWQHHKFVGETLFKLKEENGDKVLHVKANQGSASGLYKEIRLSLKERPWMVWKWKALQVHQSADLRIKEKEDMTMAVFVVFPHPWIPFKTRTLAYVWTSKQHQAGQRVPGRSHTWFVLQAGEKNLGKWMEERRNLVDDYKTVYGEELDEEEAILAIFTDNDQTGEAAEGLYTAFQILSK